MQSKPINQPKELDLIRQGVDYRFKVQCRGYQVSLRPLTLNEQTRINQEVLEALSSVPVHVQNNMNQAYLLASKTLILACTVEPETREIGPITQYLLDKMTTDEVLFLYDQYLKGEEKVNPRMETLSTGELKELVDNIKKKETQLTDLSGWQLLNLARFLIPGD